MPRSPRLRLLPANPVLLALAATLACGGGGGGSSASPAPAVPPPAWDQPVDLGGATYQGGLSLAGDGTGRALAAWLRNGSGGATEVVAARLKADGAWEAPTQFESVFPPLARQAPVAAVSTQGKGLIAWNSFDSTTTMVTQRTVAVDLGAASAFSTPALGPTTPDQKSPGGLKLAVGSDGSAMLAWTHVRTVVDTSGPLDLTTVQACWTSGNGTWTPATSYHLNVVARQILLSLVGGGSGSYLLEYLTGDDAYLGTEAQSFAQGTGTAVQVAGWEPVAQTAMPVHATAWTSDGRGGMEAWLLYTADTKAYPRRSTASGTWTLDAPVTLPAAASQLALLRQADGSGWLAGWGGTGQIGATGGLWVAPLSGQVPGAAQTLLPATVEAAQLQAGRDASGRPFLLWLQSRNGSMDGLASSTWTGTAWSTPVVVPGTAGLSITAFNFQAGPGGLVALWTEGGANPPRLRSARWH